MSNLESNYDKIKNHKYYKWGVFGLKLVAVIAIVGAGSHILAKSIRSVNDLKSAIKGE